MLPYRLVSAHCALLCSIVFLATCGRAIGWSNRLGQSVPKLWRPLPSGSSRFKPPAINFDLSAPDDRYANLRGRQQEEAAYASQTVDVPALLGEPREGDLGDRYDYDEDTYYAQSKHEQHKLMEQHHEVKEISYVYPVLLALLILGALFIPFISLFFFLSVSAFNCSGLGAGFGQVTPVFGRRRRRRRSVSDLGETYGQLNETIGGHSGDTNKVAPLGQLAGAFMAGELKREEANFSSNSSSSSHDQQGRNLTDFADSITHAPSLTSQSVASQEITSAAKLAAIMLFDALEASQPLNQNALSQLSLDVYQLWRKQLASSTLRLRRALELDKKLDSWMLAASAGSWPAHDGS